MVQYEITIHNICEQEILVDFNLAVAKADRQTAKFNSPPKFPAIQYILTQVIFVM